MVQGFKAEEECLMRARSPRLASCRIENHRLVLLVQTLMSEVDPGSDMTGKIDVLIHSRFLDITAMEVGSIKVMLEANFLDGLANLMAIHSMHHRKEPAEGDCGLSSGTR